jgi:hypothetical protein
MAKLKKVTAVVEEGPNYIFHLMAVARNGFNSDYAETYKDAVPSDDIAFLTQKRELLSFGAGSGGELVDIIIFLPSYFNLETEDSLRDYFRLLESALDSGDFRLFFQKYGSHLEKLKLWLFFEEEFYGKWQEYLISKNKFRQDIAQIRSLVLRNHSVYDKRVWPVEREKLIVIAREINDYFGSDDYISRWETLTGETFKFNEYQIVLCSAIKNGPNADSLGYDRVVFYHDNPFDKTVQFICHEIGTHILISLLREIYNRDKFDPALVYAAFETLAMYYNTIVLRKDNLAYNLPDFHEKEFLSIYRDLCHKNPRIGPRDLLINGIEAFLKL